MTLKSLDLFSGLGGFSYSFQDLVKPVAYCEIEPGCHKILQTNMARGWLHSAPIIDDIRKIGVGGEHDVPDFDIIFAGVPCQDVSLANTGPRLGVGGARTGLFWEVMRILDEYTCCNHVFIENVPAIRCNGLPLILAALAQRNFRVCWGNYSAYEVGAPHMRRRFWCFASRGEIPDCIRNFQWRAALKPSPPKWKLNTVPRVTYKRAPGNIRCKDDRSSIVRSAVLGNSIVPLCARAAFHALTRRLLELESDPDFMEDSNPKALIKKNLAGYASASILRYLYRAPIPGAKAYARAPLQFTGTNGFVVNSTLWSTPRKGAWGISKELNDRSSRDLCTQMFTERETVQYVKDMLKLGIPESEYARYLNPNPEWVEWLQGYPAGWTRVGFS